MTAIDVATRPDADNVLVVSHYYPPHVGGIEQVAGSEATGLASRGSQVTVLTSRAVARAGRPRPDAAADAKADVAGVRVMRVAALNVLERFGVPFPLFAPLSLLLRSRRQVRGARVVHVHDTLYPTSWVAAVWCRVFSRPMVITQHVTVVAHPWPVVAWVQRVVYRTLGRYVWDTAATVFYLNSGVRDGLLARGVAPDQLMPLVNGVDLEQFRPRASTEERDEIRRQLGLPLDRPLVLFVGRLVPKKGYHRLIEAVQQQTRFAAVLVGDGARVAASDQLHQLGALDRETVALAYRACDLFVLPSEAEGFPMTVQEAMASGLPVITTDDPGYDMYGLDRDQVVLIDPKTADLRGEIDRLLDDAPRRERMARYSRTYAEQQFSWGSHLDVLQRVYADAASKSSGSRLVRNSFFLLASTALTAALGLAFWSVAARLYPVAQIGVATSLISAISLLSYVGLFGLNGSIVRFLPGSASPARAVSAALTLTAGAGIFLGAAYLLLVPVVAHRAVATAHGWFFAVAFVVVVCGAAVNQATDAVFIARRAAHWNALVDGIVQGAAKLIPLFLLVSAGAAGLVWSYGVGSVVASAVSIVLIHRVLGLRLGVTLRPAALSGYLRYSVASYLSSLLNLAPLLVLPLIVLSRLGSSAAGYYYVAFQIATLLHAIPFAVCESLFAEASHSPEKSRTLAFQSAKLIAVVIVPCAAIVGIGAPQVLALFGSSYVTHATDLLRILAVGALVVAVNGWASFLLKIHSKLHAMVASNVVFLGVTLATAFALAHHGLTGIAIAWVAGNAASGAVAVCALPVSVQPLRRSTCASFT